VNVRVPRVTLAVIVAVECVRVVAMWERYTVTVMALCLVTKATGAVIVRVAVVSRV